MQRNNHFPNDSFFENLCKSIDKHIVSQNSTQILEFQHHFRCKHFKIYKKKKIFFRKSNASDSLVVYCNLLEKEKKSIPNVICVTQDAIWYILLHLFCLFPFILKTVISSKTEKIRSRILHTFLFFEDLHSMIAWSQILSLHWFLSPVLLLDRYQGRLSLSLLMILNVTVTDLVFFFIWSVSLGVLWKCLCA